MVVFDLWTNSFIFIGIYSMIIIVSCVLVTIVGKRMIEQLGTYPSKTAVIQMSIFFKLISIEIMTFLLLAGFFLYFEEGI